MLEGADSGHWATVALGLVLEVQDRYLRHLDGAWNAM